MRFNPLWQLTLRSFSAVLLLWFSISAASAQSRCETVVLEESIRITGTSPGTFSVVLLRSSIELVAGDSLFYELDLRPENGGYVDIDVSVFKNSLTNLIFFDTVSLDNSGPPSGQIPIEEDGLYFVESVARAEYTASGFTAVRVFASHGCEPVKPLPANFYDPSSELLNLKVIVDNVSYGLSFTVNTVAIPTIRGIPQSLDVLSAEGDDFATYDSATGRLSVPEIFIDGAVAFRNVVLVLTDADQLIFQLESLD